jgi:hypothetical protein
MLAMYFTSTMLKLPPKLKQPNDDWVISYRLIRIAVGWLGIALPVICVFGAWILGHCGAYQYSISEYYYTVTRSAFTGTLCAVSLFLFAYRGPQRIDALMGNLGCVFGLGIVFFPTEVPDINTTCTLIEADPGTPATNLLHYISAALFFAVLVVFSLFLFTKTDGDITPEKIKRNRVFRICGWVMIVALLLILANKLVEPLRNWWIGAHPVFWLEGIALWAFGFSWLTKAELIFGDQDKKTKTACEQEMKAQRES